MSSEITKSARRWAFEAIFDIFMKDAYANIVIRHILQKSHLSSADKRLFTELVYGVCRKYNHLCYVINQLSTRPAEKVHPLVRLLLCLGLYQLIFLTKIPESAAVNETVRLAGKVTHPGNKRFINAILRNYLRKKDLLAFPDKSNDFETYLSVVYNVPLWLVHRWIAFWGKERTESILSAFDQTPSLYVRSNPLKIEEGAIEKAFGEKEIGYEKVPGFPGVFQITQSNDSLFSYFIKKGWIYIQSLSSMIPAYVMNPQPGERILDMCAAPGSKTTQMAVMMRNTGSIDAWDLYPHKIRLIEENAHNLDISIIQGMAQDGTIPVEGKDAFYDKVLLDAPCSGLGVLGHKPEIRWRRDETLLKEFPLLQEKLIEQGATYVKKNGILVYSTCTLESAENERVVDAFLKTHKEFTLEDFTIEGIGKSAEGMMTLWPDQQGSDGFFIAKMRKLDI